MVFIGIDSRKFVRNGKTSDFVGIIGIGVQVEDYEQFKKKYSQIISDLLIKRGIEPNKIVYKSYDLNSLGLDESFYEEFFDLLKDEIGHLHVFYSYFSQKERKEVTIYPLGKRKNISWIEFLVRYLEPSFPHICLWELNKNKFEGFCYLDSFNGGVTDAWKSIASLNNFSILPNGDKVNALISSSDILITFLDKKLYKNKKILIDKEILEVFEKIKDKISIKFISNACAYSIVPLNEKSQIPVITKFNHPMIFILKEKSKFVDDKAIENSPLLREIINKCFNENGCFKLFDSKNDFNGITKDDFLLFFGEEGEKSIELFKNLGYEFTVLDLEKLKTKHL